MKRKVDTRMYMLYLRQWFYTIIENLGFRLEIAIKMARLRGLVIKMNPFIVLIAESSLIYIIWLFFLNFFRTYLHWFTCRNTVRYSRTKIFVVYLILLFSIFLPVKNIVKCSADFAFLPICVWIRGAFSLHADRIYGFW